MSGGVMAGLYNTVKSRQRAGVFFNVPQTSPSDKLLAHEGWLTLMAHYAHAVATHVT
jgi:hypothetical protein